MHTFRKIIRELHRRSVWQVLGVFLAGSWGVLQVVDFLTERAGLPDWTPTFALVLLLVGLPIVLATAFVQEGLPGDAQRREEPKRRWRGSVKRWPSKACRPVPCIGCRSSIPSTVRACSPGAMPCWAASARARC